jgi:hypothetical protein
MFNDVVEFLKQHFFIELPGSSTGHRYYQGYVDGRVRLAEVQFHPHKPISPKSLQHDIIPKSGIPEAYWKRWAQAGSKRLKKRILYSGAKEEGNR